MDNLNIINLILAVLVPTFLGFSIVNSLIKRRYSWVALSIGIGYIIGMYMTSLILRIYSYYSREFNFYEFMAIELIVAIILIIFFRSKKCSIDEIRLDKKITSFSKFIFFLFFMFITIRFVVIAADVLVKPIIPWDAWSSWAAKAKIFYYDGSISNLYEATRPWWDFPEAGHSVRAIRHPNFLPIVQTFFAVANGSWYDSAVNLPWLILGLSSVFITYGVLRYFMVHKVLALITSYLVFSLPILNAQINLGSYGGIWVSLSFLIAVFSLIAALIYSEKKMFILFLLAIVIMYSSKNTSLFLIPTLLVIFFSYKLGSIRAITLIILLISIVLFIEMVIPNTIFPAIASIFNVSVARINILYDNPVHLETIYYLFELDNWHYLFYIIPISLISLLFKKKNKTKSARAMSLFIVSGLSSLFIFIWITNFSSQVNPELYFGYVNRVILYFAPILCLIPVCVLHMTKDKGNYLESI